MQVFIIALNLFKLFGVIGVALLIVGFTRLVVLPIDSFQNQPAPENFNRDELWDWNQEKVPAASFVLRPETFPKRTFIGIAVSGGGSRAANFASGVFKELDAMGILKHAGAISCVSGGCLPSAYYALNHENLSWDKMRTDMAQDFFGAWFARLFLPHNQARLQLTDFDRSDLMAEVFDDTLFHNATFADLPNQGGPRLLVNASMIKGPSFVFAPEEFTDLGARLDTYPISYAVIASGAFPGVFNNVTLARFTHESRSSWNRSQAPKSFIHLYDGGPTDNIGFSGFLPYLDNAVASAQNAKRAGFNACLLILIDSFPGEAWTRALSPKNLPIQNQKSDLRPQPDLLVDKNVLDATDILLAGVRYQALARIREDFRDSSQRKPFWQYQLNVRMAEDKNIQLDCGVWHITFERLGAWSFGPNTRNYRSRLQAIVSSISTHYKLTGLENCSPEFLQEALYQAGRWLTRGDSEAVEKVCGWLSRAGFDAKNCQTQREHAHFDPAISITEEGTLACHPPQ